MQRVIYKLNSASKSMQQFSRFYFFAFLVISKASFSINMEEAKANPGFKATVVAVAIVNKAMREAALNPMDRFRRNNLRAALQLMPPALMLLSQDFKKGLAHDDDLPFVQGILGKYVDVNAGEMYNQFLKKPDASLIPPLASNFPKEAIAEADAKSKGMSSDGYNENLSGVGSLKSLEDSKPVSNELVDLSSAKVLPAEKKSELSSDSYQEEAKPLNFADQLSSDIKQIESKDLKSAELRNPMAIPSKDSKVLVLAAEKEKASPAEAKEEESKEEDPSFFNQKKLVKKKTSTPKSSESNYVLKVKPKYWKFNSLFRFSTRFLILEASAQCKSGKCGSKSGGGGGGGGGGEMAAALFQAAAMAAAAIVPAMVQADADKEIAKTNADAQIKMSTITSNTSKYMADNQKAIAEQQASITAQMAQANNDSQTQRLNMQLSEMKNEKEQTRQERAEERAIEKQYNDERIRLAKERADYDLQLARDQFNFQATQANLAGGASAGYTVAHSNTGLSVSRVGSNLTGSNQRVSSPFATQSATSQTQPTASAISSLTTGSSSNVTNNSNGLLRGSTVRGIVSDSLLSVTDEQQTLIDAQNTKKKIATNKLLKSVTAGRGIASIQLQGKSIPMSKVSPKLGVAKVAVGSGRGILNRNYAATEGKLGSDLEAFAEGILNRVPASAPANAVRHMPKSEEVTAASAHQGVGVVSRSQQRTVLSGRGIYGGVPSGEVNFLE